MNTKFLKNHFAVEILINDRLLLTAVKASVLSERGVYPLLPTAENAPKTETDSNIKHTVVLQGIVSANDNIPDLYSLEDFEIKIGRDVYSFCNWKKVSQQISEGETAYNCVAISYNRSVADE